MRALTGLLILGAAFAAAPATASAQADTPMCPFVRPADNALADRLIGYLSKARPSPAATPTPPAGTPPLPVSSFTVPGNGEADDAARAVLGSQLMNVWLDWYRQGWSVSFSPGQLDAEAARAGVLAHLAARLTPAEVEYLSSTLTLLPMPYSFADLAAVRDALVPVMAGIGTVGSGCDWSDAYRVQVSVAEAETPELRARLDSLVAPYGDKVRVLYGQGWPVAPHTGDTNVPGQMQQRPTLKVRDYVSLPRTKRCARTVGAKPRAGADVKRVRLAIGKRVSAGKNPRLKLKAKRSKVTVTVTLRDGTTAIETLTYRRCG